MGKVRTHEVDRKVRIEIIGEFFDIVTGLKTKKDVIDFFIGLETPSEMLMIARRIQIARMLVEGKNYDEIKLKLGVGLQTVANVNRWLYDGNDGFRKQIEARVNRKNSRKEARFTPRKRASLLDKYAHHRIFRDLFFG